MCSKHLRSPVKGDWVVAYRLHHDQPVQVPTDRDERIWLAEYLVDTYGWPAYRAAAVLGLRTLDMAVAS